MRTPSKAPLRILASLLAGAPLLHSAEPAPVPSPSEVVTLSPFTVADTDDKSWQATTTLIGSRTNQELLKVPVNVDVITSEFMRDLGAFSLDDAARFVAGVDVTPRLESRNDERVNYRGLSTGGISRNFFTWYVPSDAYNVERYDFAKGSNSLMFGDSSPGGQATVYTKKARPRNATELFASYGSYETFRFQLDANRRLHDKVFLRVNLANRRNRTYVRGTNDVFRAGHLALTYEPFPTTSIRVEAERGTTYRMRADSALAINDVAAAGRGSAPTTSGTSPPTARSSSGP